jgi:serine/threonine-protein kinase
MPLDPSSTLCGRYVIRHLHKLGSAGAVYLARDNLLGVRVAVKENLLSGLEHEQQFHREATILATVRHPNLPRVTDFFVLEAHGQYLVMDFVEGTTSAEWIADNSPSPDELVSILEGVFKALSYLHARPRPVVHGDIEPSNIILATGLVPFLVDFGLAQFGQERVVHATTGNVLVSPSTDPRSDQYALAATIYALLAGVPPPDSRQRLTSAVQTPPLRSVRDDVSPHIEEALFRALSLQPHDRYVDIVAFWHALRSES